MCVGDNIPELGAQDGKTAAAVAAKLAAGDVNMIDAADEEFIIRAYVERKKSHRRGLFENAWKLSMIGSCETLWIWLLASHYSSPAGLLLQLAGFVIGMLTVDLIGILTHFFFDNYGGHNTWLLGGIIETFDLHHTNPYSAFKHDAVDLCFIEKGYACLILATAYGVGALNLASPFSCAQWSAVAFFGGNIPFIHKAAHTSYPEEPMATLQRWGILINKRYHQQHHRALATKHSLVCGYMDTVGEMVRLVPNLEAIVYLVFGAVAHHSQLGLTKKVENRPMHERPGHILACWH